MIIFLSIAYEFVFQDADGFFRRLKIFILLTLPQINDLSAALSALLKDGYDFVYIHLEAPDEMGHQGSAERKIQARSFP